MEKAECNRLTQGNSCEEQETTTTTPCQLPTLSEIKREIPAHCFHSSVRRSMSYVIKDIVYVILTFSIMYQIDKSFKYGYLLFPIYWYIQGTLYTAFFILGHDCGHSSFSSYPLLNDTVGTILHTWILVPYYTWKVTHNKHHKNTNNIDKDEVFYPQRGAVHEASFKNYLLYWLPGIGWFHYLIFGYRPRGINHFNPFEPLFYNKHLIGLSFTLGAYIGMCYLMYFYAISIGFISLILYHLIPVFIFACYIVIITMLHHTEIDVPWYGDSEWNNVKGQLSTVDRHYGHVHSIIHSIGTHQIHHLFTKVPHYHLEEATIHFRNIYPDLVRINDEPILMSFHRMWKIFINQRSIKKDVRVFTYSKAENYENKKIF
ncbi:unnamed protein product [Adineta steineri]|uniref:Fatty acid desaturase domain-containing protein n=1 Tax=Adineta steineri TaxID=433720 RepID=A0A814DFS7_9BILA|nr:unnamed protein product [Adineta steineri]CAF0955216.1 unnamed protein product [Adineta steineri]CAF0960244.1 unnamed protein product [Adineta steineri]